MLQSVLWTEHSLWVAETALPWTAEPVKATTTTTTPAAGFLKARLRSSKEWTDSAPTTLFLLEINLWRVKDGCGY